MDSINYCFCCLLRQAEKQLTIPYCHFGKTEIYSDMIQECFDLHLVNSDTAGICEECVGRLRDASDFKLMVQHSQAELQARLLKQHNKPSIGNHKGSIIPAESIGSRFVCKDPKEELSIITFESEDHESTDVLSHTSETCGETFDSDTNQTMAVHNHKIIAGKSDTFENQFTKFCLQNNDSPNTKIKNNPVECTKKNVTKKPKKQGPFNCDVCSLTFATNHRLGAHKRIHRRKIHACHICNIVFQRKFSLTRHIMTHNEEKPFSCDACDKRFKIKNELVTHQRFHSGDVLSCDICNKRYIKKRSLVAHILAHTDAKSYKCDICNTSFISKGKLRSHIVIHNEEKPFVCEFCNFCSKSFKRKYNLHDHLKVHTQHRAFECEFCGNKFSHKSNFKKHTSKVHKQ